MVRAADYLEKLARNQLERSAPLEIGACLPAPGPSMGPGFLAHDSSGKSFDPVPNLEETVFFVGTVCIDLQCFAATGPFCMNTFTEAPNAMNLVTEKLPRVVLDRYRVRRKAYHVYRAAVRLWGEGMDFQRALSIGESAFSAATWECEGESQSIVPANV